jgi:hypothetical protein
MKLKIIDIEECTNTTTKHTEVTMENKQTAVDFIFSQLPDEYTTTRQGFEVYKQAKQMENDQIIDAWDSAIQAHEDRGHVLAKSWEDFEEYFEHKYGGNK